MAVIFLTLSYAAARIIILLDDCCILFAKITTIVSSVLITSNSIGATFWHNVLMIYSALYTEDTWMEEAYAWLFVVKSVVLKISRFFF